DLLAGIDLEPQPCFARRLTNYLVNLSVVRWRQQITSLDIGEPGKGRDVIDAIEEIAAHRSDHPDKPRVRQRVKRGHETVTPLGGQTGQRKQLFQLIDKQYQTGLCNLCQLSRVTGLVKPLLDRKRSLLW